MVCRPPSGACAAADASLPAVAGRPAPHFCCPPAGCTPSLSGCAAAAASLAVGAAWCSRATGSKLGRCRQQGPDFFCHRLAPFVNRDSASRYCCCSGCVPLRLMVTPPHLPPPSCGLFARRRFTCPSMPHWTCCRSVLPMRCWALPALVTLDFIWQRWVSGRAFLQHGRAPAPEEEHGQMAYSAACAGSICTAFLVWLEEPLHLLPLCRIFASVSTSVEHFIR